MTITSNQIISYIATFFFALAILHTFFASFFNKQASKYPNGSVQENFFHLLGEVEVIFGFWSFFFILSFYFLEGKTAAVDYLNSRNYSEPLFVFIIMIVCSSKPVKDFVNSLISATIRIKFVRSQIVFFFVTLALTPLLGSFITEPAAMTIVATLLLTVIFEKNQLSEKMKYSILGLLFVNISIGGTLTPYAAPPVLMVADKWDWTFEFMLNHFGWKAILSCFVSTLVYFLIFKKSILAMKISFSKQPKSPMWVQMVSLVFVMLIVTLHKVPVVFIGLFLFFLGFVKVTQEFQEELKIKESLLVGFFLSGLVVLGGLQNWWLEPVISHLGIFPLFLSSIGLTAVIDNAAITYLGTLVAQITDESKYALVAGAVIGGGLTVIANAPNPAGYGILRPQFGDLGIKAGSLFLGALLPTFISAVIFWFL